MKVFLVFMTCYDHSRLLIKLFVENPECSSFFVVTNASTVTLNIHREDGCKFIRRGRKPGL